MNFEIVASGGIRLSALMVCFFWAAAGKQEELSYASAVNGFAYDFLKLMNREQEGNYVFSPHSIVSAFASLYPVASERLKSDMRTVFRLTGENAEELQMFNSKNLRLLSQSATMSTVWFVEKSILSILPSTSQIASQFWPVDFISDPEGAEETMNAIINASTAGAVPMMFPEGTIKSNIKLAVASTMHFRAKWKMPFNPRDTKDGPFFGLTGKEVVSYMVLKNVEMWQSNLGDLYAKVLFTPLNLCWVKETLLFR